jgi:hypothetical protein
MEKFLVINGDPVGGFSFTGPFDDHDSALTWAEQNLKDNWWIASLESPKES